MSATYAELGKKILDASELPQGFLQRYERDVASIAYIISRKDPIKEWGKSTDYYEKQLNRGNK